MAATEPFGTTGIHGVTLPHVGPRQPLKRLVRPELVRRGDPYPLPTPRLQFSHPVTSPSHTHFCSPPASPLPGNSLTPTDGHSFNSGEDLPMPSPQHWYLQHALWPICNCICTHSICTSQHRLGPLVATFTMMAIEIDSNEKEYGKVSGDWNERVDTKISHILNFKANVRVPLKEKHLKISKGSPKTFIRQTISHFLHIPRVLEAVDRGGISVGSENRLLKFVT